MGKYCQPNRTPCDALTQQLGKSIFASPELRQFVLLTTGPKGGDPVPLTLIYCPFCGCHLEELPFQPGEEVAMRIPRKRAKKKAMA